MYIYIYIYICIEEELENDREDRSVIERMVQHRLAGSLAVRK